MADAASCAGVDASLRADMGVAERGGSDEAGNISIHRSGYAYSVHIYLHLCLFVPPVPPVTPRHPSHHREGTVNAVTPPPVIVFIHPDQLLA